MVNEISSDTLTLPTAGARIVIGHTVVVVIGIGIVAIAIAIDIVTGTIDVSTSGGGDYPPEVDVVYST